MGVVIVSSREIQNSLIVVYIVVSFDTQDDSTSTLKYFLLVGLNCDVLK
jgi:hypothetical protein